jgi:threonine synthase
MTAAAYADFPDAVVPLRSIGGGLTLVGLSEGPTLAFKDMAMQFLGQVLEYVLEKKGRVLNIVGATSGDTGSAAEHALRGKDRVSVFMLSPQGRMSSFQRAQMYSLHDANVHNIAVDGVFDDCQNLVKKLAGDLEFKRAQNLGAVNSINLGRIAAQVVYYFWAWLRVTDAVEPEFREGFEVSFTVPSGNFGNILSGFFAKGMGVPIRRLVLAANENNVLDEFFRTGVYRVRSAKEVFQTSSPSMDISKASNFERYVYDLVGRDPVRVRELWRRVETDGEFDLSGSAYYKRVGETGFVSDFSTHADRIATIRSVHERHGYIVDTHTADGIKVGMGFRERGVPLVCLETALAVKFDAAVREALGVAPPRPKAYEGLEALPQRFEVIDADAAAVKRFIAKALGGS